jgi:hypothetical protein
MSLNVLEQRFTDATYMIGFIGVPRREPGTCPTNPQRFDIRVAGSQKRKADQFFSSRLAPGWVTRPWAGACGN